MQAAALLFLQPTQRARFAIMSGLQLARGEKQLSFLLKRGVGEELVKATPFPLQELTPGPGWVT